MTPTIDGPRVRWGLIGAGRIGKAYLEAAGLFPKNEFVWCADPAIPGAPSYEQALEQTAIDAALVCTPPNLHYSICADLLARGIPTLCEKPIALSAERARNLANWSKSTGTLFSQPAKFRAVPEVIEARRRVLNHEIGDLIDVDVSFSGYVDMSDRWNSNADIAGGGVLMDNGSHAVDLIRYIAGPITAVQGQPGASIQYLPVEDSARLEVQTEAGVRGCVWVSWSHNSNRADYLRITGTAGTIEVGWKGSFITTESSTESFGGPYQKLYSLGLQLERFASGQPLVEAEEAAATVAVIEAGYRSFQSRSWETVKQ